MMFLEAIHMIKLLFQCALLSAMKQWDYLICLLPSQINLEWMMG